MKPAFSFPMVLVVASVCIMQGCEPTAHVANVAAPKVKVTQLVSGQNNSSLYFPAVAHAAERAHLSFRVEGEINSIKVKDGDQVTQGQVIATLDPTDLALSVDNARARYSVVNSQFQRSKPLVEKGLLAKSQFDEIAAQRQIALAELDLAKLRLSFTQLKAPIDGVITRVSAETFENIQVGQQVVNIHSVDRVEVKIQLPDMLYLNQPSQERLNQISTTVRLPNGTEHQARVQEFTTEPDPATGAFTVTLTLPMPKDELILDGMAVDVTSSDGGPDLELNQGISVPIEALFNGDGDALIRSETYVWVVDQDSKVEKRRVSIGKASQHSVQIMEGLAVGETVVTAGVTRLRSGMTVDIIEQGDRDE